MQFKLSLRCFIISLFVKFLRSENIFLKCDNWSEGVGSGYYKRIYADTGSFNEYCTVTGLNVTHVQNVVTAETFEQKRESFMKFYDSNLLYIPQSLFSDFDQLSNLDVSKSGIIEVSRNTFTEATNLRWLNISHNAIHEITGSVFVGAHSLRDLDLSRNQIQRLSEFSFKGLSRLINLDLSSNLIVNIEKNLLSDSIILETLNLRNNKIDHVSSDVFAKLTDLTMIDLSENSLTHIEPNIFKNSDLRSLWISHNKLTELLLNVGEFFKVLQADHNEVESFFLNCSGAHSNQPGNGSCPSLQKLILSNNKLRNLSNITGLPNLKQLRLAHNDIGKVNISTFARLSKLETLDLRNTNLSGLTFGTFSHQSDLKFLDISDNGLKRLNLDIFLPYMYRHLEEFYISGNNLTEISGRHSFSAFSSLERLGLNRNQFNCSYLLNLITFPATGRKIEFSVDNTEATLSSENIHGIECSQVEGTLHIEKNLSDSKSTALQQHYEQAIQRLQLHEKQLEQHLVLMRSFVVIVAALGLLSIIFAVTYLVSRNRGTWINSISYKSTHTIQSEVDIP